MLIYQIRQAHTFCFQFTLFTTSHVLIFFQSETEKSEYVVRVTTLREDVRHYEDQVKDQALRLGHTQDEASQHRSTATQMK